MKPTHTQESKNTIKNK